MKYVEVVYKEKTRAPQYTVILKDGGIMYLGEDPFNIPKDMIYRGSCGMLGMDIDEFVSQANDTKSYGIRIHPNLLPDKIKEFLNSIVLTHD